MDQKKEDWGEGRMRRVENGVRDVQKKKKKDWGGGKMRSVESGGRDGPKKKTGDGER